MNYPNKICHPFISLPTVFTDMLSWYDTLNKLYGYLQQQEEVIKEIQEKIDGGSGGGSGYDLTKDPAFIELRQMVLSAGEAISSLSTAINYVSGQVNDIDGDVAAIAADLQITNQNVQTVLNRVIANETRLSTLEERVAVLESRPSGLAAVIEEKEVIAI